MACCEPELNHQAPAAYRNVLIAVLAINLIMFAVEAAVGLFSGSRALRADALDFLGDAATYGLTLWALGQSLTWRFRAARIKGLSLLLLGLLVLADSLVSLITGAAPPGVMMSGIGALALVANLTSLALLVRYRQGDANIRSAWLCTRNDVLANLAVIVAGLLVLATGSHWPDVLVAMAIAALFCHSAVSILRQAAAEQRAGEALGGDCHDPAR
ncbi:MAG: cation transporter [Pseudomonadota bacterium]|jgi:cation diffusion facilitator family transporter|nr:cation transporter [Pseudomonadota bacterium]HCR79922.1 cation transporter [Alcanivorax sp.]|tara:strand:- start:1734 stop:2375 length:642 start_codon:yes stop_codon:yes gene_type:complete